MKIFIFEKDMQTLGKLKDIARNNFVGDVVGCCSDIKICERQVGQLNPDVLIIDILISGIESISLISRLKRRFPDMSIVGFSGFTSKDFIAMAYEKGMDYYIYKPVNEIEITSLLARIKSEIEMKSMLEQMKRFCGHNFGRKAVSDARGEKSSSHYINKIMKEIGILGESGSKDIVKIAKFLIDSGESVSEYRMKDLCEMFTENPKTMEQRIRRAAAVGMSNIATMGIEDYMNKTFEEYSSGLYNFEQVRKEMDSIRGRSGKGGKINLKKFIDGIVFYAEKSYEDGYMGIRKTS